MASEAPRDPPGRWLGLVAAFVCCFGADARTRDRLAMAAGADAAVLWNPIIARAELQSHTKRVVVANAARSTICGGPTVLAYRRRDPVVEHGVTRLRNSRRVTDLTAAADRAPYGILGTDLGISLELDHRMYFFFGDTEVKGIRRQPAIYWPDSVGYTDADIDPEHTALGMKWITGEDPAVASPFKPITIGGDYRPSALPEEKYGGMVVPTGVFANPMNHHVYLFYSSIERNCYSVIAKATSFGPTDFAFDLVMSFSVDKFVEVSPVVVQTPEIGVYAFGTSKDYRRSKVYLAYAPIDDVERHWRFLTGVDPDGSPQWADTEADAVGVFDLADIEASGVGEISVVFDAPSGLWLMTYQGNPKDRAHDTQTIVRYADAPWGPWHLVDGDPPGIVFDMRDDRDGGVGTLFHKAVLHDDEPDDGLGLYAEYRDSPWLMPRTYDKASYGSPYAPFFVPHWFKRDEASLTLFYALSSWRPYESMLMRTTLDVVCGIVP